MIYKYVTIITENEKKKWFVKNKLAYICEIKNFRNINDHIIVVAQESNKFIHVKV
jgi:hypothetical protein